MATPEIDLEIHAPGLDLHRDRWNYHVMFMDEVHRNLPTITRAATSHYSEQGRGSLYVGPRQWMEIIEGEWKASGRFPCDYMRPDEKRDDVDFGPLGDGHRQMMREYKPDSQLILTVLHHPGEMLSAYLIRVPTSRD